MVSGTNDRFLRTDVAIRLAYERMEPALIWKQFVNPIQEDNQAFIYRLDKQGKAADPKKEKPAKYNDGAQFPEIDRSRKITAADLTASNGFSMRIPRKVITSNAGKNEIMECYDYAGYWLAEYINKSIIDAMIAGATLPDWAPTAVWSDPSLRKPSEDLRKLKYCMRREGYPFRLTDVFVNIQNYGEYESAILNSTSTDARLINLEGLPKGGDTTRCPIAGCDITGLDSGLDEGSILGLDVNNPAAEFHYYVDSKYGTATVSYKIVKDGVVTPVNEPNLGIHFKQYEEDDSHDTILQFWAENKTVVTKPYGILYDTGI